MLSLIIGEYTEFVEVSMAIFYFVFSPHIPAA